MAHPTTASEAAKVYNEHGWQVVRVPKQSKNPIDRGWPARVYTPDEFAEDSNIGLKLGKVSQHLTDTDLDAPEAHQAAPVFLPATPMVSGRRSNPQSHRFVITSEPVTTVTFEDPVRADSENKSEHDKAMLLEVRANAKTGAPHQTVVPPSIHESGEPITWVNGLEPAGVSAAVLLQAAHYTAVTALVGRYWPGLPHGHNFSLALAGALMRSGLPEADVTKIVGTAARIAGYQRFKESDIHDTAKKLAEGEPATGWTRLKEFLDERVVKSLSKWVRECPRMVTDGTNRHALRDATEENRPAAEHPEPHAKTEAIAPSTREDTSNARRFADQNHKNVRYWSQQTGLVRAQLGTWLNYTQTHWPADETGRVVELAKKTALSIFSEASRLPKEEAVLMGKWAERSLNRDRLAAMLELAKSDPRIRITTDLLDRDPWLLNFQNGTLDLRDGELREHRREDYITKIVRCRYDRDAVAPRWRHFVRQTFGDLADWIQKAVGYSLTGLTSEKAVFLLCGPTDAGKTTFLDTVRTAFVEYAAVLQIDTLMWSKRAEDSNTRADLADLRGARLAITSETEKGQRLREAKLRQISQGTGLIKATRKYENPILFDETHKLWIDCNHLPEVRGTDDATWNRLLPIPCTHRLADGDKDPGLKQKLLQEKEGIAAWGVEGAGRWHREGLERPALVSSTQKDWRRRMDLVGQFIEDMCVERPEVHGGATPLYEAFAEWARKRGIAYPMTAMAFGTCLTERRFEKDRDTVGRTVYLGIALRSAQDG